MAIIKATTGPTGHTDEYWMTHTITYSPALKTSHVVLGVWGNVALFRAGWPPDATKHFDWNGPAFPFLKNKRKAEIRDEVTGDIIGYKPNLVTHTPEQIVEIEVMKTAWFSDGVPALDADTTPDLLVTPEDLDFGTVDTVKTFTVANNGGESLLWTATVSGTRITAAPAAGVGDGTVTVTLNRQATPGSYTRKVRVASNGGTVDVAIAWVVP